MKREDVIKRLCVLVSEVGLEHFQNKYAHDCFCIDNEGYDFQFSEEVIAFIENVVRKEIFDKGESKEIDDDLWKSLCWGKDESQIKQIYIS